MEKTYRHLLMVMLAVVISLGLAACGDDNKDTKDTEPDPPAEISVVGTWKHTEPGWDGYQTMTLTADGKYYFEEIDNEAENWEERGTYTVEDDVLTIKLSRIYGGDTEVHAILSLTASSMTLRYEGEYFGQSSQYYDDDYKTWTRIE